MKYFGWALPDASVAACRCLASVAKGLPARVVVSMILAFAQAAVFLSWTDGQEINSRNQISRCAGHSSRLASLARPDAGYSRVSRRIDFGSRAFASKAYRREDSTKAFGSPKP